MAFRSILRKQAFSTSKLNLSNATNSLAYKLDMELKHELSKGPEPTDWISEFKASSPWTLNDKPGFKEVELKRTFGNEKISVIFSTDSMEQENFAEEMDEQEEPVEQPVSLQILIEKESEAGGLEITATTAGDGFFVDHVSYFSKELIGDETAQGDWSRRGVYGGPTFEDLDEDLIENFQGYIEERGFNEELAKFIPEYLMHKEQLEYVAWLEKVKKFIQ